MKTSWAIGRDPARCRSCYRYDAITLPVQAAGGKAWALTGDKRSKKKKNGHACRDFPRYEKGRSQFHRLGARENVLSRSSALANRAKNPPRHRFNFRNTYGGCRRKSGEITPFPAASIAS